MDSTSALSIMVYSALCSQSAEYLRQTILLTAYETPEIRSLYNNLKNVAGKIRLQKKWHPVQIPEGIDQVATEVLLQTD